jgi:hypothetical protein
MHALIRVDLHPERRFKELWNDRTAYDEEVVRLFCEVGLYPQHSDYTLLSREVVDFEDGLSARPPLSAPVEALDIGNEQPTTATLSPVPRNGIRPGPPHYSDQQPLAPSTSAIGENSSPAGPTENGSLTIERIREYAEWSRLWLPYCVEVMDSFIDVPPDVRKREFQHLIMLGNASDGQSRFVVCAVNPTELQIRMSQGVHERLQRGCSEIFRKIKEHRLKTNPPYWNVLRWVGLWRKKKLRSGIMKSEDVVVFQKPS